MSRPPDGILLVVEDDPDHAFLVGRRLSDAPGLGQPVEHLSTAADAAARVGEGDVRCVVLDLTLPDARGVEAVHALLAVDDRLPIVVLTGLDSDSLGVEALQAGAQDYLVKGRHADEVVGRSVRFAMERVQRQQAEHAQALLGRQLQRSEAQLSEAQRMARIGSWEWDLATDEVVWSDELQRLSGLYGEVSFDGYLALVAAEDRAGAARLFSSTAAERSRVVARHRIVRPDGCERWVQGQMAVAAWDDDGRATRVLGTMQDVTEQKAAEDLIAHQALHDTLTGLVNRGVLLERLSRVLGGRGDALVAVVLLDVDRFKWVNDSRTHAVGDRLLVAVARALSRVVRPTDTLARFGGDEFVVLCEQLRDEDELLALVQQLGAAVEQPLVTDASPDPGLDGVTVTASIGVATARTGSGADAELLVRDADIAMYRAKERGRARFEVFDEDMRERATARLQMQSELTRALQCAELEVHHQPVVDPRTGLVSGSEALVRWRHPQRGILLPDAFIPQAEETGLIVPLGASVLTEACATTSAWNRSRRTPLSVSVNLSARQLTSPDLVGMVAAALRRADLPPHLLCLEVTETVVMQDAEASGRVLAQLRELGVRIAIDDFGTGYSSLAYLLSLPVDVLKVDRSFVAVVNDSAAGAAIVTAVLALARSLGIDVVAEGVETLAQRDRLVHLGVTSAQGWLWGRAVAVDEARWSAASGPVGGVPPVPVDLPSARAGAGSSSSRGVHR